MPSFPGTLILSEEHLSVLLAAPSVLVLPILQRPAIEVDEKEKVEPAIIESDDLLEVAHLSGLPLLSLLRDEGFSGAFGTTFYLPALSLTDATAVLMVGLGVPEKLAADRLHIGLAKGMDALRRKHLLRLVISLDPLVAAGIQIGREEMTLQAVCATSDMTYHSLEARERGRQVERLVIRRGAGDPHFMAAVHRARSKSRDLVNMPANTKTTQVLVSEARSLPGAEVLIEEDPEWIRANMPCFFEVAKGSLASDPPRWISALYRASGGVRKRIALIGKSVIFDTGGYQVKSDAHMNTMKADMTGGATVLSVLREAAGLSLPGVELRAYCAVTPNKIDSHAMTCDSIVDAACGKKVEIRHTDAEGRLTLIDAVTLAEREKPDLIITVATLTGSAIRAVGPRIALMSNSRMWRDRFESACQRAGEAVQTLEVVEEDFEDIKSKLDGADINNTGNEKYRGAQTAAAFVLSGLKNPNLPLLHLDIAGGDMTSDEKATGIVVKGLMAFLVELSAER